MRRRGEKADPGDPRGDATLRNFATFYEPDDAEGPILSTAVRVIVHEWLQEISWAEDLENVGLKPRRRSFFAGPPGCGKTTLAHHIAARLGLPLALIDMQVVRSMYVGATGQNVAQLFRALETYAGKMVTLLDEFDTVANKRKTVEQAADREANAIVNAFLQRFDRHTGLMIAASNFSESIDPALWRRFDMHLEIGMPDDDARWAILKRYLVPFDVAEPVLDVLTDACAGASPALLRQLAENMKRSLVLGPRFQRKTDLMSILITAAGAISPPEGADHPGLWAATEYWLAKFDGLPWPPQRSSGA